MDSEYTILYSPLRTQGIGAGGMLNTLHSPLRKQGKSVGSKQKILRSPLREQETAVGGKLNTPLSPLEKQEIGVGKMHTILPLRLIIKNSINNSRNLFLGLKITKCITFSRMAL